MPPHLIATRGYFPSPNGSPYCSLLPPTLKKVQMLDWTWVTGWTRLQGSLGNVVPGFPGRHTTERLEWVLRESLTLSATIGVFAPAPSSERYKEGVRTLFRNEAQKFIPYTRLLLGQRFEAGSGWLHSQALFAPSLLSFKTHPYPDHLWKGWPPPLCPQAALDVLLLGSPNALGISVW